MMTIFGGDLTKSHFSVQRRRAVAGETRAEGRVRRLEEAKVLKQNRVRSEIYFQFTDKDKAGEANAHKLAVAEAAMILSKTGIEMEVVKGAFL